MDPQNPQPPQTPPPGMPPTPPSSPPISPAPPVNTPPPFTTQPAAQPDPNQKKILLVEDEEMIRELYARQLTKAGFNLKTAPDAEKGLEILKAEQFDLLLLDIMLPGMNGLQLFREFKVGNPDSKMIVILLTNLGQESVIKEGFELGAYGYLIKTSYTPDQIVEEVKNALQGKPSQSPAVPQ